MFSARSLFTVLFVVLISLLLNAGANTAGEFSGSYTLGAPSAAGRDIQISITFNIENNTSSGVDRGVLSLHEPQAARVTFGEITGISIAAGGSSRVTGSFRVPRALYESWQKGSSPAVSIHFNDAEGNSVRAFIQF
jgi:hypothetical protein